MGQALKAIVFIVSACLCGGRRPGFAPAGDLLSCARQERRRRYAPHSLRPLRGNLRRGACGVRRGTHCAPAALRSNKCGESVHEAGVSFGTPATPQAPRRRRSQKGGEAPYGPSLRSAPRGEAPYGPSLRSAPRGAGATRRTSQAERSDGPWAVRSPGSLQDVPRSTAASGSGLAIV